MDPQEPSGTISESSNYYQSKLSQVWTLYAGSCPVPVPEMDGGCLDDDVVISEEPPDIVDPSETSETTNSYRRNQRDNRLLNNIPKPLACVCQADAV